MHHELDNLIKSIKTQNLLPEVENSEFDVSQKTILNAYLLISLQAKRELNTEVLIRVKNFAEFIVEMYLDKNYNGLIVRYDGKPYLNTEGFEDVILKLQYSLKKAGNELNTDRYLSLPLYAEIIRIIQPDSSLLKLIDKVNGVNTFRNQVAHGFKPINMKNSRVKDLAETCWMLLLIVNDVDEKWRSYFEDKNKVFKEMVGY